MIPKFHIPFQLVSDPLTDTASYSLYGTVVANCKFYALVHGLSNLWHI